MCENPLFGMRQKCQPRIWQALREINTVDWIKLAQSWVNDRCFLLPLLKAVL